MALETSGDSAKDVAFPWHLGVYDAHCHPTDTMHRVPTIQTMKTRVLTVMATRSEDQDLVDTAAVKHGVKSPNAEQWSREECIIPCFGWHPWFAHQMYLDQDDESTAKKPGPLQGDAKIKHYQSVLQPNRPTPSDQDMQIYQSLPSPTPFSTFLSQARANLHKHPLALVGEIGLDRSFRIPESWSSNESLWTHRDHTLTPGGREGRRLTPFRCTPAHQKKIFTLQLQLAAELGRGVSVHGVQAHGLVFESLRELWRGYERQAPSKRERKKLGLDHASVQDMLPRAGGVRNPYPPRICLHSYSGNASNFKRYMDPAVPARIFASFSTAINLGDALEDEMPRGFVDVVKMVPDHMLLVESDLHTAGEEMDTRMEDMVRRICKIKGWGLEHGVSQLGRNWRAFVFGDEHSS